MKRFFAAVAKSLITTIIFFAMAEVALRGAYLARNTMVRLGPLPYAPGDEYGPIPPWLDRLLILVPDNTLIWRNLPHARRPHVGIFTPLPGAQGRGARLGGFPPTPPPELPPN